MSSLDREGLNLLRLLIAQLETADPARPDKMIGYKDVHKALGLQNVRGDWGESLKEQGLNSLATWTKNNAFPAITGIIVNRQDSSPGKGYYSFFGRENDDWAWWTDQIIRSKSFDWSKYLKPRDSSGGGIEALLSEVLNGYQSARTESFAKHRMASLIRDTIPTLIQPLISDGQRYLVKGSPGQGGWADVPWVAIFDRLVTESAQNGYYLVYLFDCEAKKIYLSLNQGVTAIREQYGANAHNALKARAHDLSTRLGLSAKGLIMGPIELSSTDKSSLGAYYESGAICSIVYHGEKLPTEDQFKTDFQRLMFLYDDLVARDDRLFGQNDAEDDEVGLDIEDVRKLREHKRIERNRSLAKKAKKFHGYICKACGFDFEKQYGEIGKGFIEAHHLTPLSKLKGQVVKLSPEFDFTVLCPNCHRMIHKTDQVGSVKEFQSKYVAEYPDDGE